MRLKETDVETNLQETVKTKKKLTALRAFEQECLCC